MIIQTLKHTREDLELWEEYADADAAHSSTPSHARKIEQAIQCLKLFGRPDYVSVSWGKDSIVAAHLAQIVYPGVRLLYIKVKGSENPDNWLARDAYSPRNYVEIEIEQSRKEKGTLNRGFAMAARGYGARHVNGVRASESPTRRLSAFQHGMSTENVCRPLLYMSTQDVFSYIESRGLYAHPAYAYLGNGRYNREHIRVATVGGRRGDGHDRLAWEKEYYPETLLKSGRWR